MKRLYAYFKRFAILAIEAVALPILILASFVARYRQKKIDVGIGPDPLVNNIYHKKALELKGYRVETFVDNVFYITQEFDIRADLKMKSTLLRKFYLFFRVIFNYKSIYIYFNGGPLRLTKILWRFEPFLYRLARVKVVVTAYGADIQDFTRCPNLLFKHFMTQDYPAHKMRRNQIANNIDLWTRGSSHIIGGCDWVDYLYHWDTLTIAHFCIDTKQIEEMYRPPAEIQGERPLRIIHAPNHRGIKGTEFFVKSVNELKAEGENVEIVLLERVERKKLLEEIAKADIVADQLIIGWYAMFTIEALAMKKPVLCHLREDFLQLYQAAGLLQPDEVPIINCNPSNIKEKIRYFIHHRDELKKIGESGKEYVEKHHSLEYMGNVFDKINRSLGIQVANI